ncbi:hypothetical protein AhSzq1_21 [Aeromonas phage AhSzq-1]|uniref:Uncharacterized protein n=1 Tax=Aeromonas phage AhSzq-1 TaxID=2138298 RepID=A0A2R4ALI6_9CAUD|nr:hypothetical protein HOT03_gp021 [Aeromonas phage AhSzq-1]AVR75914.1 hypothetical protein AhSzq1_21 [Aeromonas phage AhSzq-1]
MIKRLLKALAVTVFALLAMPFIFFSFASLLMFDAAPLIFMFKRVLEFPEFEVSRQLAIIFSSVAVFILIAIYQGRLSK